MVKLLVRFDRGCIRSLMFSLDLGLDLVDAQDTATGTPSFDRNPGRGRVLRPLPFHRISAESVFETGLRLLAMSPSIRSRAIRRNPDGLLQDVG